MDPILQSFFDVLLERYLTAEQRIKLHEIQLKNMQAYVAKNLPGKVDYYIEHNDNDLNDSLFI